MTRICYSCKKVLGEKCPECGAEANRVQVDLHHIIPNPKHAFMCLTPACPVDFFPVGHGGDSHGLCEVCLQKALDEIPKADAPASAGR